MPGTIPATIEVEAAAAATLADARICAVSCNDGAQVGVDTSNDMPALEVAPVQHHSAKSPETNVGPMA